MAAHCDRLVATVLPGYSRTLGRGRYQRCEMDTMHGCDHFVRLMVLLVQLDLSIMG
jgi:hypothetical protein